LGIFLFVVSVVASGKSVILFQRWRRLRPVTDGGDDFTAEKGEKSHTSDL
jgi:hypothetical protein